MTEAIKEIRVETAIEETEETSKAEQAFEIALGTEKHVTEHVTKSAISARSRTASQQSTLLRNAAARTMLLSNDRSI